MPEIRVIVVEPKNPGNLGSIARVMKNFGVKELFTVNAPRVPPEDLYRAMKGEDILRSRINVSSLRDAIEGLKLVVGTSGVSSKSRSAVLRKSYSPRDLRDIIFPIKGKIGIVFGREDIGLTNEELGLCDMFIQIPTSATYPIMNVSHSVAVILYELYSMGNSENKETIDRARLDRLVGKFRQNLIQNNYPSHRIEKTELLFRRVMARAGITDYEYRVLMGTIGCRDRPHE